MSTTPIETDPDPDEGQEPGTGAPDSAGEGSGAPEGQTDPDSGSEGQEGDGETFSRAYVQKLRRESKGYRDQARKGETALTRLTDALMREATNGVLLDPTDLEFDKETMTDDDGFPDVEKIKEAAEDLVSRKPHLAYRAVKGDIGQGVKSQDDGFSLAGILRTNAG